jgi:hypothetical protein
MSLKSNLVLYLGDRLQRQFSCFVNLGNDAVHLEKAYGKITRTVMWWALEKHNDKCSHR